jgi:hypothetical protein
MLLRESSVVRPCRADQTSRLTTMHASPRFRRPERRWCGGTTLLEGPQSDYLTCSTNVSTMASIRMGSMDAASRSSDRVGSDNRLLRTSAR